MRLACTTAPGRGEIDRLLAAFAATLSGMGRAVRGVVQANSERADGQACDMHLHVLPDGPAFRISEARGHGSKGCRLDAGGLEAAVAAVEAGLDGADILIVNKFGKHEAEGRGFRGLIAEALSRDIPVLVGLSARNAPEFAAFAGDCAEPLAPDLDSLLAWHSGLQAR